MCTFIALPIGKKVIYINVYQIVSIEESIDKSCHIYTTDGKLHKIDKHQGEVIALIRKKIKENQLSS